MGAAPVRGTQSFVGVMAEVFRRPSLTGLEVLWRWVFWCVVLLKPARWLIDTGADIVRAFQGGGFERLGVELVFVSGQLRFFVARDLLRWLGALALWLVVSAAARALLLRRLCGPVRPGFGAMLVLNAARWCAWAAAVALWGGGLLVALQRFVLQARASGEEAAWVPFCGVTIFGTLVLFVLWLGASWVFSLASIYVAQGKELGQSLREALRRNALAGKLAEINLVMGIVKIALLVLALVFSACPLPFETVETQTFLVSWTAGVLLLYFVASDYFHVVRLVAFLRMTEVLAPLPLGAAARGGEAAS